MKTLMVLSRTMPEAKIIYGDSFTLHEGDNNMLGHWDGSAMPNGSKKDLATGSVKTYRQLYGMLACGTYSAQCIQHHKYNKCLLIGGGKALPGRYPNPNPKSTEFGKMTVAGVFNHCGFSLTCRGSMACLTIKPDQWADYISHFEIGERINITIVDQLNRKWV